MAGNTPHKATRRPSLGWKRNHPAKARMTNDDMNAQVQAMALLLAGLLRRSAPEGRHNLVMANHLAELNRGTEALLASDNSMTQVQAERIRRHGTDILRLAFQA